MIMMNTTMTHGDARQPRRLHDLEQRFGSLFAELNDSPHKEAISVLHGMMQELWRQLRRSSSPSTARDLTIDDIAELYRHAPKMEGAARSTPLPVGTKAPEFALPDSSGRVVTLQDFRGQPLILAFYPLDWSPGCSQQLDLYQHELDEFTRRGARVAAISVDSVYSHGACAAVRGIGFPLLAAPFSSCGGGLADTPAIPPCTSGGKYWSSRVSGSSAGPCHEAAFDRRQRRSGL
jgi:hypothetical protein